MANNGYPVEPPPYSSHDDFNDIDNNVFETDEQTEQTSDNNRSRYRKKGDKTKTNGMRERSASASSVKLQLNRLSEKEVADATMANVFGKDETEVATTTNKRNSSAMKVNPLYDQNGAVEVSSTEVNKIRSGSVGSIGETTQDYDMNGTQKYNTSSKPYKKSKKKTNSHDEDDNNSAPEPKIAYSKNFRFKGPKQNGQAKEPKKLTAGRIMPSRISRNAIPGSQIMASLAGKERPKPRTDEYKEQTNERHPDDVEAVARRTEMRKKWRLLIALILIILIFSLILVVVLLFATKAS